MDDTDNDWIDNDQISAKVIEAPADLVLSTETESEPKQSTFENSSKCVRGCRYFFEVRSTSTVRLCLKSNVQLPTEGHRDTQLPIPVNCSQYDPWSNDEMDLREIRRQQSENRYTEDEETT